MNDLSPARIEEIDLGRQFDDIVTMADHLQDAIWRVESAGVEPQDAPGGLVVAGMGGSAIGGALAQAALGDRASRPIGAARSYGVPPRGGPPPPRPRARRSGGKRGGPPRGAGGG